MFTSFHRSSSDHILCFVLYCAVLAIGHLPKINDFDLSPGVSNSFLILYLID